MYETVDMTAVLPTQTFKCCFVGRVVSACKSRQCNSNEDHQ